MNYSTNDFYRRERGLAFFTNRVDENSFDLPSATVREVFDVSSRYPRDLFDTGSGAVREVFDCCSGASRRTTESHPKQYRSCPEPVPKRTRSAPEGHPNSTRRNRLVFYRFLGALKARIKYRCSKDVVPLTQLLRKMDGFSLKYIFGTSSIQYRYPFSATTTQAQPKNDLRIVQETPKVDPSLTQPRPSLRTGYRQGSPKDGTRNTQETANNEIGNGRLMYRECTVSVQGVYRKGTGDLLRSYWRSTTDLLNACTSGVDQWYSNNRGAVDALPRKVTLCWVELRHFSRKLLSLMASKNKSMPSVLALICFMLFNLSTAWAQSAESRTAEGQPEIKPLEVGQKVPEEFWRLKHSFLEGEVVKEGTLEAFKGKVLLLDFWETYCSPCLKNFPVLDSIQEIIQGWGEIVLVNEKFSGGTKEKISASLEDQRKRWDIELTMAKIIKDEKLRLYFKHLYIPHYVLLAEDGTVLVMGSIEAFDAIRKILAIYSYNNSAKIN